MIDRIISSETFEEKVELLRQEGGIKMEIISGVPVFTVDDEKRDESLRKIANIFGQNSVFRIINSHFAEDALAFGTDRITIDVQDFRFMISKITRDGYGLDVWGLEQKAEENGLRKSDVFCGFPYEYFLASNCKSTGLGIPEGRSAVLIFDSTKVVAVPDTDGYTFKDPENKKEALLALIKFKEQFFDFEMKLASLENVEDKITLLEREVLQNMNTPEDKKKAHFLALSIIALIRQESLKNTIYPSELTVEHLERLHKLLECLKYELAMIDLIQGLKINIASKRKWFEKRKLELPQVSKKTYIEGVIDKGMPNKLNELIEYIDKLLLNPNIPPKYADQIGILKTEAENISI